MSQNLPFLSHLPSVTLRMPGLLALRSALFFGARTFAASGTARLRLAGWGTRSACDGAGGINANFSVGSAREPLRAKAKDEALLVATGAELKAYHSSITKTLIRADT